MARTPSPTQSWREVQLTAAASTQLGSADGFNIPAQLDAHNVANGNWVCWRKRRDLSPHLSVEQSSFPEAPGVEKITRIKTGERFGGNLSNSRATSTVGATAVWPDAPCASTQNYFAQLPDEGPRRGYSCLQLLPPHQSDRFTSTCTSTKGNNHRAFLCPSRGALSSLLRSGCLQSDGHPADTILAAFTRVC